MESSGPSREPRSSRSSPGGPESGRPLLRQGTRRPRLRFLQPAPQILDDPSERLRRLGVRVLDYERLARIAANHDPWVEGHAPEERQAEFLRGPLPAAHLENGGLPAAVPGPESAHVLDDAEDVHLDGLGE